MRKQKEKNGLLSMENSIPWQVQVGPNDEVPPLISLPPSIPSIDNTAKPCCCAVTSQNLLRLTMQDYVYSYTNKRREKEHAHAIIMHPSCRILQNLALNTSPYICNEAIQTRKKNSQKEYLKFVFYPHGS